MRTNAEKAEYRRRLPLRAIKLALQDLEEFEETPQVATAMGTLRQLATELEAELDRTSVIGAGRPEN
ncbi:MAG: hypothetical protein ACAH95_06185 [Fimbriimonas sp.]